MVDIIHRIGIKSSAEKVYSALTAIDGLAAWWTRLVTGESTVGGNLTFKFRNPEGDLIGSMLMEVKELKPDKFVRWRCIDGPSEWIGTDITFELSLQDGQIILLFGHRNWREATESTAHCSMKWATFLLSLRELVESGNGRPAPDDLKIDNWN